MGLLVPLKPIHVYSGGENLLHKPELAPADPDGAGDMSHAMPGTNSG
jgi:hypothetical protein